MEENLKKTRFHYAWILLLAVSLIRGFSGPALNGSSGLFLKPVTDDLGIGVGQLSLYLSISSVVTLFWLPVAGNLLNKFSVKTAAIISIFVQALSFAALGLMNSVWGWYTLAIPLAMSAAVLVNLMGPVLVNRWFASNQGLVMGIMMTITSLLGAVFQPLLTNMIGSKGWQFSYVGFGLIALIGMLVIAVFLLKNRPEDKNLTPFVGIRKEEKSKTSIKEGVPAKQAVKTLPFYMLVLFMMILTGFAAFSQHMTTFGISLGYPITTIGTALSLSMIGSAVGSVLIGLFSDKWGAVRTSIAVMAAGFASIILFFLGGKSFIVFAVASFLFGLAISSIGVIAPVLTTTFFGYKDYEKLFSYVMMGSPLASILLLPAYGFVYDHFESYVPVLAFLAVALIIGAFCAFVGNKASQKHEKDGV